MREYNREKLESYFDVTHIIEISYRGIADNMIIDKTIYKNFWCLYYIDRGGVEFNMPGGETIEITSGKGIFFSPGDSFLYSQAGKDGANILSVFFECDSFDKEAFNRRIRNFDTFERMILSELVNLGNTYFERYSKDAGGIKGTVTKKDAPLYVSHLVKASIEFLLLRLYKSKNERKTTGRSAASQSDLIINSAVEFMYKNVRKKLSVMEIAASVKMSESNFQAVFKKITGQSVMNYFNALKAEQAKIMIRQKVYTYGEIASELGFSSESYFSRHFKKITGMTPSEYARLIYYG